MVKKYVYMIYNKEIGGGRLCKKEGGGEKERACVHKFIFTAKKKKKKSP